MDPLILLAGRVGEEVFAVAVSRGVGVPTASARSRLPSVFLVGTHFFYCRFMSFVFRGCH